MIKNIDKQFLLITFVFLSWVTLWVSINALPYEIDDMTKSFINFINGSRSIAAILFSLLSFIVLFFLIILKNVKKTSIVLILFALYFIFQLIGLATNEERTTDIQSAYLALYALGTISLLMIIDIQKLHKILPYMGYFALIILSVAYFLVLTQSGDDFIVLHYNSSLNLQVDLYYLFAPNEMIFYQAPPRITGLTRSFGIISLSLLIVLFYKKNTKILSPIIFALIIILSMFIWIGQSKGSILCYYSTSVFFIIFLNDLDKFKKFLTIISITLFSIVISNEIINVSAKKILKKDTIIIGNDILESLKGEATLDEDLKNYIKKKKLFSSIQKIKELEILIQKNSLPKDYKDKLIKELLALKKNPGTASWLDAIQKLENELKDGSGDVLVEEFIENELIKLQDIDTLSKNLEYKFNSHFKFYTSPRIFKEKAGSYTSGRIALWKTAIKKYEKNKLFGYGPQADRILLLDPEDFDSGNNVSNTMIYGLLTGGYFSLVMIILIYIYTGYMILNYFLIKKIFLNKFSINKENIFVVASIVYTFFFMVRSIFENSFGVFSIDFLITILSLFVIENKLLKKN